MNIEEINEIINDYFKDNRQEIVIYINKQVEKQVKESIREMFNANNSWDREDNIGTKMIKEKINVLLEPIIDGIVIDKEEIRRKVNNNINRKLKNLNVNINI